MPDPSKTTDAEKDVLTLLAHAWNKFIALDPAPHPTEAHEFNAAINAAQNVLACRLARRADPGVWAIKEERTVEPTPWDGKDGRCKNCGDELFLGQVSLCGDCDALLRESQELAERGEDEAVLATVKALGTRRVEGRARWAKREGQKG